MRAGPPRSLHHAILLAFSVDPGVKALDADGLCIDIAVAAQRKQPTLLMRMRHYLLFPPEIEPGRRRLWPVLTSTPSMDFTSLSTPSPVLSKQSRQMARCMDCRVSSDGSPIHSVTPRKPAQILVNV